MNGNTRGVKSVVESVDDSAVAVGGKVVTDEGGMGAVGVGVGVGVAHWWLPLLAQPLALGNGVAVGDGVAVKVGDGVAQSSEHPGVGVGWQSSGSPCGSSQGSVDDGVEVGVAVATGVGVGWLFQAPTPAGEASKASSEAAAKTAKRRCLIRFSLHLPARDRLTPVRRRRW